MVAVAFTVFTFSCGTKESGGNLHVSFFEIDQSTHRFVQDASDFLELERVIKIPSDASANEAAYLDGFLLVEDELLAYSTYLNTLVSVSNNGEIKWSIKGGADPVNNFGNMDMVKHDIYDKEIKVYDGIERSIYSYDYNGNFLRKEQCDVNFLDFEVIGSSSFVFDASLLPNTHLQKTKQEYSIYSSRGSGKIEGLKKRTRLESGLVPFIDNANFLTTEAVTYYKPNFGDTTFIVKENSVKPFLVTRFSSNNRSQLVLDEVKTGSVARRIFDEEIPFTDIVVPSQRVKCATYTSGGKRFIYADGNAEVPILNTQFIKLGHEVLPVPDVFSGGYFFSVAKDDNRNAVIEAVNEGGGDEDMEGKYNSLIQGAGEDGGLYVYVFRTKK